MAYDQVAVVATENAGSNVARAYEAVLVTCCCKRLHARPIRDASAIPSGGRAVCAGCSVRYGARSGAPLSTAHAPLARTAAASCRRLRGACRISACNAVPELGRHPISGRGARGKSDRDGHREPLAPADPRVPVGRWKSNGLHESPLHLDMRQEHAHSVPPQHPRAFVGD